MAENGSIWLIPLKSGKINWAIAESSAIKDQEVCIDEREKKLIEKPGRFQNTLKFILIFIKNTSEQKRNRFFLFSNTFMTFNTKVQSEWGGKKNNGEDLEQAHSILLNNTTRCGGTKFERLKKERIDMQIERTKNANSQCQWGNFDVNPFSLGKNVKLE